MLAKTDPCPLPGPTASEATMIARDIIANGTEIARDLPPEMLREVARECVEIAIDQQIDSDELYDFVWTHAGKRLADEYRMNVWEG